IGAETAEQNLCRMCVGVYKAGQDELACTVDRAAGGRDIAQIDDDTVLYDDVPDPQLDAVLRGRGDGCACKGQPAHVSTLVQTQRIPTRPTRPRLASTLGGQREPGETVTGATSELCRPLW